MLKGYRTVLFNAFLALVPLALLGLEHLEQIDLVSLGVTPDRVLFYTLAIKAANIFLRSITTTAVGRKEDGDGVAG